MKHRTKKHFEKGFQLLLVVAFITTFLVLVGCGGGGSSSSGGAAANTAPTANDGTLTINENQAGTGALIADDRRVVERGICAAVDASSLRV